MSSHGDLKVWWCPQVPMQTFEIEVDSVEEAKKVCTVLAKYDMFLYENNVRGDYANGGGLIQYNAEDGEWWDYIDENGDEFDF